MSTRAAYSAGIPVTPIACSLFENSSVFLRPRKPSLLTVTRRRFDLAEADAVEAVEGPTSGAAPVEDILSPMPDEVVGRVWLRDQ